ncbi:MAG: sigma-54-dependent Fis family transcriptional regulator [Ectothiorhodospiraceae bacterium]|nr:sigma-54-dependent Fis family transcriptional regulator [Ectothiorhodospiraceae bacterium]
MDSGDWRLLAQRPGAPRVVLTVAGGSGRDAVQAIRDGAVDFLTDRDEDQSLLLAVERQIGQAQPSGLVACDATTRELMDLAVRVAERPVTVMLTGESGTGKEVFARYIHEHSPRSKGPFVAVNCAAIPEQMLEAVLFGYEKGAFTGAHRTHTGKFEQAAGGTLLLDEVSEIDLNLQAKLLRVLQEREVERLCGHAPIPTDVRVIATTNRDLREEVAGGRFREDLYYRLQVFPLQLPPLRQRQDDIVPLAEAFIVRHCPDPIAPPALDPVASRRLRSYAWPGNVRELENVIQRALVLCPEDRIGPEDLRFDPPRVDVAMAEPESLDDKLKEREHRLILDTLEQQQGSRKATAEQLGISVRTLRYKLQRMREQGFSVPNGHNAEYA